MHYCLGNDQQFGTTQESNIWRMVVFKHKMSLSLCSTLKKSFKWDPKILASMTVGGTKSYVNKVFFCFFLLSYALLVHGVVWTGILCWSPHLPGMVSHLWRGWELEREWRLSWLKESGRSSKESLRFEGFGAHSAHSTKPEGDGVIQSHRCVSWQHFTGGLERSHLVLVRLVLRPLRTALLFADSGNPEEGGVEAGEGFVRA